jgi:hypothetical protein
VIEYWCAVIEWLTLPQSACNSKLTDKATRRRRFSIVGGTDVSSSRDGPDMNDTKRSSTRAIKRRHNNQPQDTRPSALAVVRSGSSAFGRRVLACSSATILGWSVIEATILFSYRLVTV